MNKNCAKFLRAIAECSNVSDMQSNVVFDFSAFRTDIDVPCIRKIAPGTKIPEKDCEQIVQTLIQAGYIEEPSDFLSPKTELKITELGIEFFKHRSPEAGTMTKDEALQTHVWHRMGSKGGVTKDKYYPMGSICKKCRLSTFDFETNPRCCK